MARRGRPPKNRIAMVQHGIRIPEEHWDGLVRVAERMSKKSPATITPSDLVREAIREYIKRHR